MKVCRPDFYKEFQCIGSACQDTCCAQWEIEVDETSADRYEADGGPLAEEFRKYLVRKEDENYFRLTTDKRCPFLNEENLCRMILTMGEDSICDICREHPRFYHWFGEYTEVGLGLCCEEAGRLLFSQKEPLCFEILSDGETEEQEYIAEEDYWVELLLEARKQLIDLLQDRSLSLEIRVEKMIRCAHRMQPFLEEEDLEGLEELLENHILFEEGTVEAALLPDSSALTEMLAFYEKLESLDDSWPEKMREIKEKLGSLLGQLPDYLDMIRESGRETEYEQLLMYFVFRYFMEAIYDGSVLAPLLFTAVSLRMILLLDLDSYCRTGSYTLEDRIRNAKWYSKEIEYCPDNMERLAEVLEEKGIWQ